MIRIDLEEGWVEDDGESGLERHALDAPEAFAIVSRAWLRCGWDTKYVYSFTWMGRPLIQLPDDMLRIQEAIYRVKPDVILETGIAHGGSLVFYAGLCRSMARGRVIGVDIEIRPHNREAIEQHELFDLITLVEGDSTAESVIDEVRRLIEPAERVLVVLDANHTKEHVLRELEAYSGLVSVGSYIIAADGIMGDLAGAPRTEPTWVEDNPRAAAEAFVAENPCFRIVTPTFLFNEGEITEPVTYWRNGWIERVR